MEEHLLNRLLDVLACPNCKGDYSYDSASHQYICKSCGQTFPSRDDKPIFIDVPSDVHVFEKRERGPDIGTPWRQANWRFLNYEVDKLASDALILDVGSGRGDFQAILKERDCLSLDIYPYPESDVVADLTQFSPFKQNSFDMVVLMNVMEHVFDTRKLLQEIAAALKPGGVCVIAIPFLLKVHQAPYDFVRYTEFGLRNWVKQFNLEVALLEGYYDPIFLLEQSIGNIRFGILPRLTRINRILVRSLVKGIKILGAIILVFVGQGYTKSPQEEISPAPFGYHLVCRKPKNN